MQHPKNGKTALMFSTLDGRPDIVKALLNLGVDPNIQDNDGNTALNHIDAPLSLLNAANKDEILQLLKTAEVASRTQKAKLL